MESSIFSQILRDLISSRGVNQSWLADKADTTEATISRYVKDKTVPEIPIVIRIARAFNVSVDYLFGLTNAAVPRDRKSVV